MTAEQRAAKERLRRAVFLIDRVSGGTDPLGADIATVLDALDTAEAVNQMVTKLSGDPLYEAGVENGTEAVRRQYEQLRERAETAEAALAAEREHYRRLLGECAEFAIRWRDEAVKFREQIEAKRPQGKVW